jgi:hypothetical protein
MSMDKIYSRINISKGHIFDHSIGATLCGTKHGWSKPNKTKLDANDMLFRHSGIAELRGGGNAYKYCCMKCESKLKECVARSAGSASDHLEDKVNSKSVMKRYEEGRLTPPELRSNKEKEA